MWSGDSLWGGDAYHYLEKFPELERYVDVPLENVTCIALAESPDRRRPLNHFMFGDWRIEADVSPHISCEDFKFSWNKDKVDHSIRFRVPLPTAFTIKHYHKLFCETEQSKREKRQGDRKLFCKMKNTLSFCFDNGDTLSFTNIMNGRIYDHVIRLFYKEEQALLLFV